MLNKPALQQFFHKNTITFFSVQVTSAPVNQLLTVDSHHTAKV